MRKIKNYSIYRRGRVTLAVQNDSRKRGLGLVVGVAVKNPLDPEDVERAQTIALGRLACERDCDYKYVLPLLARRVSSSEEIFRDLRLTLRRATDHASKRVRRGIRNA